MDNISVTDLRHRYFGPTLDESILYGVECLRGLFRSSNQQSNNKLSDLHLYKSTLDTSIGSDRRLTENSLISGSRNSSRRGSRDSSRLVSSSVDSNLVPEKMNGKKRVITSTPRQEYWRKLSQSSKALVPDPKPSQSPKLSSGSIKRQMKKEQSTTRNVTNNSKNKNSLDIKIPQKFPPSPPEVKIPNRSKTSPEPIALSANKNRPKLLDTRWAIVRVQEFADSAKTYEIIKPSDTLLPKSLLELKKPCGMPPDCAPEVIFATLPDASVAVYHGDISEKRKSFNITKQSQN
ncbi:uncharacterized protein LOC129748857 isoform X2 [Uranotaenia lowii]|uniref:uncharacterized protein LOC129748857 isoform X2 n=1 Tax=Uranotaenia lowii TaxID=190385 RepID=UPI00247A4F66|nr:uncharacterized protein LOC129748857 isoform X2 [Uranotaenia lowii]